MNVEIYSDVVCPWCYIGKRRFAEALAGFPDRDEVDVVMRPYQLDPGAPATAIPVRTYLARRFGPRANDMTSAVSEAAAGVGITIDWDAALSVNTRTAHRLMRLALEEYGAGTQQAVAERLFAAHFVHGGDVSDHVQLVEIARESGIDPARATTYLASGEGSTELDAELAAARRAGIQSVPTFIFEGKYAVSGAQPVPVFRNVLDEVRRLEAAAAR